jgi:hypothetical protein
MLMQRTSPHEPEATEITVAFDPNDAVGEELDRML